jgi:hypothetical protein
LVLPDPPIGVLRATFNWFARKADLFVEEAVKAGGKLAGPAVVVGVGAAASGRLPDLATAIHNVLMRLP